MTQTFVLYNQHCCYIINNSNIAVILLLYWGILNEPNIAVVSGDKESSVLIMNRSDYFNKLQHMIDEGIQNGVDIVTEDRTLEDLKLFCSFLYHTFKKYEHYEKMLEHQINQDNYMGPLKNASSTTLQILQQIILSFAPL